MIDFCAAATLAAVAHAANANSDSCCDCSAGTRLPGFRAPVDADLVDGDVVLSHPFADVHRGQRANRGVRPDGKGS